MTYHLIQSVAYMALAAGGVSGISDSASNLSGYLGAYLNGGIAPDNTQYPGFFPQWNPDLTAKDWATVWGPVVELTPGKSSGYAANSMYVAYSENLKTYVVAIAGTDFANKYDIDYEDLDVAPGNMQSWPIQGLNDRTTKIDDEVPKISLGTYNGVSILLSMSYSADGNNSNLMSLSSFLASVEAQDATLIFTGHSLGGALSPTLALALYTDQTQSVWKDVHVLALAGPTPGNKAFASIFNSAFPQKSTGSELYPYWNTNYQNIRDMVPRAWNRLQSIQPKSEGGRYHPTIWGKPTDRVRKIVDSVIELGVGLSKGGDYSGINHHVFGSDATWGYFKPGPLFSTKGAWGPEWNSLPSYGIFNPIGSEWVIKQLARASHVDQYYCYFQLIPLQPLPRNEKQIQAERNISLKSSLMLAIMGLSLSEPEQNTDDNSELGASPSEYDDPLQY